MSGAPATPTPATSARSRRWEGRGVARLLVVLALVLAGVLALRWGEGPRLEDGARPWLPAEHRPDDRLGLVRLEIAREGVATTEELLRAADHIRETLGAKWRPLEPPAEALAAWTDAHALLLMPLSQHAALQVRMTNTAIEDAVRALRGRLASPFFALIGAEARRDPLGLRSLARSASEEGVGTRGGPTLATDRGDALRRDGRVLWLLHAAEREHATWEALTEELAGRGITLARPQVEHAAERVPLSDAATRLAWLVAGGLTALLAAAYRAMARPLALVIGTGLLACACLRFLGPWDALALPWLALTVVGAVAVATIPGRIAALGGLLLATALVPLAWSPIPTWAQWGFPWFLLGVGMAGVAQLGRLFAAPTDDASPDTGDVHWTRRAWIALVLTLGSGAVVTTRLAPETFAALTPSDAAFSPYAPDRIVWAWSAPASSSEAALDAAALDTHGWSDALARSDVRIEGPGHLLLAPDELARRREALGALGLADRLAQLEHTLQAHGFRSAAFGEFLRGAADEHQSPSSRAALQTPLARWIKRHLADEDGQVRVRTSFHLPPDAEALPRLTHHDGTPVQLFGPAAFEATLRPNLPSFVVSTTLVQLWLAMTLVWLRHRDLRRALFVAAMAVATLVTTSLVLVPFDVPPRLAALPAWLWLAAYAAMATVRGLERPRDVRGTALLALLPVVPALAFAVLGIPEWMPLAAVLGVGGPLAVLWGCVVAPRLLPAPPRAVPPAGEA